MSKWTLRVETHNIHAILQSGFDILELIEKENTNPDVLEDFKRIEQVFHFVKNTIIQSDPVLVPLSLLEELERNGNVVNSELHNYRTSMNATHMVNANNNIDAMLRVVAQLKPIQSVDSIEDITKATTSYMSSFSQILRSQEDEHKRNLERLANLQSSVDGLFAQMNQHKTQLDSYISQKETQYNQSEAYRQNQFNTEQNEKESDFKSLLDGFNDGYKSLFEEIERKKSEVEESSKEHISKLKEYLAEAESYLRLIGNKGKSGGFERVADSERLGKRIWRGISVSSIFVLIGLVIWDLFISSDAVFSWWALSRKVTITAALGTLFTYAAKQAAKHEEAERFNRKLQLDLSSIDLYLKGIDQAQEVKVKLSDKFFGPENMPTSSQTNVDSKDIPAILKAVSEIAAGLKQFVNK